MKIKRILILYAPLGVGHGAAAEAIAEEFVLRYPNIEIRSVNVLDFVADIFRNGLPWVYSQATIRAPILYKWVYNHYNHKSRFKGLNNISGAILKKSKFVKFITDFKPDFIISTNPLSMQLVSMTKEKDIINIPSANVCTDFGFHSFWSNEDVNYYFVANEEVKKSLIKSGILSDKIQVTGIPITKKFNKSINRKKIINGLNFDKVKPILLIVGGRISYKNLVSIIGGFKKVNNSIQFIIVAGRDDILQNELKNSVISKDPSVRIFNFVNNLEDYMTVADIIITKAGGLTVSECLVKNLPMIFTDIIPGQEEDNVNYVVKNGAGIKSEVAMESIKAVNDLIINRQELVTMKDNCKKIAKPNAARDIVNYIISHYTYV